MRTLTLFLIVLLANSTPCVGQYWEVMDMQSISGDVETSIVSPPLANPPLIDLSFGPALQPLWLETPFFPDIDITSSTAVSGAPIGANSNLGEGMARASAGNTFKYLGAWQYEKSEIYAEVWPGTQAANRKATVKNHESCSVWTFHTNNPFGERVKFRIDLEGLLIGDADDTAYGAIMVVPPRGKILIDGRTQANAARITSDQSTIRVFDGEQVLVMMHTDTKIDITGAANMTTGHSTSQIKASFIATILPDDPNGGGLGGGPGGGAGGGGPGGGGGVQ